MYKINILGLGPGSKEYILPITSKIIEDSHIIIGAKRNLESIDLISKEIFILENNYSEMIIYLNNNKTKKKISVVVSGDTGFYSLLKFIKKHIPSKELNIVPGISSMQYLFSKIGHTYENAFLTSLHGRNNIFLDKLNKYDFVGLLTDKSWTPSRIARVLKENNLEKKYMYIGENLTYSNEKITKLSVDDATCYKTDNINVVIISGE